MSLRCIVGLGNPGARYEGTRHNIGFEAVTALLQDRPVRRRHFDGGFLVEMELAGRDITLLCPMGYMNRSGGPVRRLLLSERLSPQEALVVCDDYALPLGTIRTRLRGSDGGHNGLASILSALETDGIPRMRLGIGNPPAGEDPADFVMKGLSPAKVKEVLIDEETGTATVIVPDYQLSLAIGKEGQNARLAARMTGWRVDIKSETQVAQEAAYADVEWAEGEWIVNDETGEQVWQPAEGGPAVSAGQWTEAATEGGEEE